MDAADLTTAQAAVLAVVSNGEWVTQSVVATQLGLNQSAVTAMVNRLMKLNYLERTRSARDGRAWQLSLTPKGRGALKRVAVPFNTINSKMEAALGQDDVEKLAYSLNRLIEEFTSE